MWIVPPSLASPLLREACRSLTRVDTQSALLLNLNNEVVGFALDHNLPHLATLSLRVVEQFDTLGSWLIHLVLLLASSLDT